MRQKIFITFLSVPLALLFLALVSVLFNGVYSTAQDDLIPLPTAVDQPETRPSSTNAPVTTHDALRDGMIALHLRSPFDFSVVYLMAENAVNSDPLTTPDSIRQHTGAQIAYRWEDVLVADRANPIRVLLVHASALDLVDTAWTHAAFRRGVSMIGINLYATPMADITGNECVRRASGARAPQGGFALAYTVAVAAEVPENLPAIYDHLLFKCEDTNAEEFGAVIVSKKGSEIWLQGDEVYDSLARAIVSHASVTDSVRLQFEFNFSGER